MDDNTVQLYSGYEEIGIPGKNTLRQLLTDSTTPEAFRSTILGFQHENGIILPSLQPMLPLLHLLNIRSLEFHESVMEELRQKLINRIEEIASKVEPEERDSKLKVLLQKSFPFIKVPMIQPVVMELLKNIEVVDDKYINMLVNDQSLYQNCDVSVKRHIWQQHQTLLIKELSPLLATYIKDKEAIFANIKDPGKSFFTLSPKVRRQNEVLQTLAQMVGRNVVLYDTILQFLRTVYVHTQNTHYCTLRVSLLMELHDAQINDITSMDPCHKFAWCLDACIREQNVNSKDSKHREMQAFLESIRDGDQVRVLGDVAMALNDPYAVNFLSKSILRMMNQHISNESLPRNNHMLHFLLRLLNLGLHSRDLLDNQIFNEPILDVKIITRFIPILISFMVDDHVRAVNAKLPPDDRESALTIIEHCGPPPDDFQNFINKHPVAAVLAIYYSAHAAQQRDVQAVTRVFGTLTTAHNNITFHDPYMHILVAGLVALGEEFSNEELCSLIFDEIFLPALGHDSVVLHLIKLIYHVHGSLSQSRLHSLISTIQSFVTLAGTKDIYQNAFKELKEKIEKPATEPPSTPAATPATPSTPGIPTGNESYRHMMTPSLMSPSPAMSPYFQGSHNPSSPGPFSPAAYQSPFQSGQHHQPTY